MSEVLGFSASNTYAVMVTASRTSSPFSQFTLGTFSTPAFSSLCLFCGCFWLVGQVTCNWGSVLVFGAFSGDSGCVLGALGFLLPPAPFVGCRSFFGVESRVRMGMLVMLGFLGAFAARVVGPGPYFLLLAFYHAGSVSVPL